MIRWLKRTGIAILVLAVLAGAGVVGVYVVVGHRLAKDYPKEAAAITIPVDSASIEHGRHLVESVNKCAVCHGDNLAGRKIFENPMLGRLYSANLTSGNGGVAGGFTDADWIRAVRHGIAADNRPIVFMPSDGYYYMNDPDMGAVVAYLKTLKPVDFVPPPRRIGVLARVLTVVTGFPLIAADKIPVSEIPRPIVPAGPSLEYGRYLTTIGACAGCHGPSLSGGQPVDGVQSANITPAGLQGWTEQDFTKVMRTGIRPGGRVLSAAMPWPYTTKLTDDELHATWLYLRSLPSRKTGE